METRSTTSTAMLKYPGITFFAGVILYFGKTLFIPMCYGLFIAIVLYPVCKWLERHKWSRSLSITAGLLIVTLLFGGLVALLVMEVNALRQELPALNEKLKPSLVQLQEWIKNKQWWTNMTRNLSNNAGSIMRSTLSITAAALLTLFLVPVFAALFLYSRRSFVQFVEKAAGSEWQQQVRPVLKEVIHTYFNFIKGMLLVYLIVGILNSIGLLALGIPHAILFGMLTAIMTIIPYVGIIISALLPISMAWILKDSIWYPLGVVAIFGFVQYLEANVIFPRVVGAGLNHEGTKTQRCTKIIFGVNNG